MSKLYVNEVHSKTGSTKAIEIDSDGRVLTPNRVAFSATRTAGSVTNGNFVAFDSVDFNIGNAYNSSTGVFTCPVAGIYFVQVQLISGSTVNVEGEVQVNGTRKFNQRNYHSTAGTSNGVSMGGLLDLSVSDEVKVKIIGNSNIFGQNGGYDVFSMCLMG